MRLICYPSDLSSLRSVLTLLRPSTRWAPPSSSLVRSSIRDHGALSNLAYYPDLEPICNVATLVLQQKAFCQQDPDQDEEEEAPEDQAEYDSVLVTSAGDVVSSIANALGPDFAQLYPTFFPLISKFYVSSARCSSTHATLTDITSLNRRRTVRQATALPPSDASPRSSLA